MTVTSSASALSLLEHFYHWEKTTPHKLYMSQPIGKGQTEEYSWQRTGEEIRRIATYLKSFNFEPGSRIALLSKNCAHWVMADLAIWMAGYVSVPLYPTLTAETVNHVLLHSESKLLFVGKLDGWSSMQVGVPMELPCVSFPLSPKNNFPTWEDLIKTHSPMTENPVCRAEDLATIIYTSGTTGTPKGVMQSFGSLAIASERISQIYHITDDERILSYLPMSHVAERLCAELASFTQGFTVYFSESLETFARDLQYARPTLFFAVPRIWTKFQMAVLAKMPQEKLKLILSIPFVAQWMRKKILTNLGLIDARICISGAAPIPSSLIDWYATLGLEISEAYGMTENFAYSHSSRKGLGRAGYVGQSNPGVVTKIGDDGEILVHSPCTMMGYYKEPEKTAEVMTPDGFLRTGDKGEIDPQGRLKITGRAKEIFKTSKGKYVAPSPIESFLLANTKIEQACVMGEGMPQPIALLMLSEATLKEIEDPYKKAKFIQDLENWRKQVNGKIDAHERLKTLVVVKETWGVENNILTPTLKIKRNVLEAHYHAKAETWFSSKQSVVWED